MNTRPRLVRWVPLAGLALIVGACAGTATTSSAPPKALLENFTNRAFRGPVSVYWSCSRPEANVLQVEGVAVQKAYPGPTRDLTFRLEGLDGRGATVSWGTAPARDSMMYTMEQNPFRVTVRTVGSEARFNLTYTYWLHESGGGSQTDADTDDKEIVAQNVCPAGKS
jgi:hypothetical protein